MSLFCSYHWCFVCLFSSVPGTPSMGHVSFLTSAQGSKQYVLRLKNYLNSTKRCEDITLGFGTGYLRSNDFTVEVALFIGDLGSGNFGVFLVVEMKVQGGKRNVHEWIFYERSFPIQW